MSRDELLIVAYLQAMQSQALELARLEPNEAAMWTEAAHALESAVIGVRAGEHRAMVRGAPMSLLAERIRVHRRE